MGKVFYRGKPINSADFEKRKAAQPFVPNLNDTVIVSKKDVNKKGKAPWFYAGKDVRKPFERDGIDPADATKEQMRAAAGRAPASEPIKELA